jgi:very-short-patch-repair endonuclease
MLSRAAHALRQASADAERIKWLERQGGRVVRFWNSDILANIEALIETILTALRPAWTLNPAAPA